MDIQALLINPIKERIWKAAGEDLEVVRAAMEKAGANDNSEKYWNKVLRIIKPVKKREAVNPTHYDRYNAAKLAFETTEFPNWVKDGHYLPAEMPDVSSANGLTNFITQYLTWRGHRATRISSAGRQLPGGKFIPSTTRKGSADISSTIHAKSVMWEVKVKNDRPSPAQIKEQERERRAGGEYFFVHNVEEFFRQYDGLVQQKGLFS